MILWKDLRLPVLLCYDKRKTSVFKGINCAGTKGPYPSSVVEFEPLLW